MMNALFLGLVSFAVFSPLQDDETWAALWKVVLEPKDEARGTLAIERIARCGPRAARVAAQCLRDLGGEIQTLLSKLDNDDVEVREAATLALIEKGAAAEAAVRAALKDESAEVRARVEIILRSIAAYKESGVKEKIRPSLLLILGRAGGREHLKDVTPFMTDSVPEVREAAVTAASRLAATEDARVFADLLKDKDERMRARAVGIVGDIGGPEARAILLTVLREDGSPAVRRAFDVWFTKWGIDLTPEEIQALFDNAAGRSEEVTAHLLGLLMRTQRMDAAAAERWRDALLKAPAPVKLTILGSLGPSHAEVLVRMVGDADERVRSAATSRLAALVRVLPAPPPQRLDPLVLVRSALEEKDPAVRAALRGVLYGPQGSSVGIEIAAAKGDIEMVVAAAANLRPSNAPGLVSDLNKLIATAKGRERDILESAAAVSGDSTPRKSVRQLLYDKDPRIVELAIRAAAVCCPEGASHIREFLDRSELRLTALEALTAMRDQGALQTLARHALAEDTGFALLSTKAIAKIGGAAAAPYLMELLQSGDPRVRRQAMDSIKGLPLTQLPDGFDEAARGSGFETEAKNLAEAAMRNREIPALLREIDRGDFTRARSELRRQPLDRLRFEVVKGDQPEGDEAFTDGGAIRVSETVLAKMIGGPCGSEVYNILGHAGGDATPEPILALIVPGEKRRYLAAHACLSAGRADVLPKVLSLVENDTAEPRPTDDLLDLIVGVDPKQAAHAAEKWLAGTLNETQIRFLIRFARKAADRADVLFRFAEHQDKRLAVAAAGELANFRSPVVLKEARARQAAGRITDRAVLYALLRLDPAVEDLPLFRSVVTDDDPKTCFAAAHTLVLVGGRPEVGHALPAMKHGAWGIASVVVPHVGEEHRGVLKAMLDSKDYVEKRPLRLLLVKAGGMDPVPEDFDAAPRGNDETCVLAWALESVRSESIRKKVLSLAERWPPGAYRERLWLSLLNRDGAMDAGLLEKAAAAAAASPRIRAEVLRILRRDWRHEYLGALKIVGRGLSTTEEWAEALRVADRMDFTDGAEMVREWAETLLGARFPPESAGNLISRVNKDEVVGKKLLAAHHRPMGEMSDIGQVHKILRGARGISQPDGVALVRQYLTASSNPFPGPKERHVTLSSRLIAAESLAACDPEAPGISDDVDRLSKSDIEHDLAVAVYYRLCRGARPTVEAWGTISLNEASLYIAVESRLLHAAKDALVRYREMTELSWGHELAEHYAAATALLASRDFGFYVKPDEKDAAGRRRAAVRSARDWILANFHRSFEDVFAESLRDAGYAVGDTLDGNDLGDLIRAARDSRWYLARNAVWMLNRLSKEGPRRLPSVAALGEGAYELHLAPIAPPAIEVEAWENWWKARNK